MNNYEIKKGNRGFIKDFADLAAAEAWATSYFTDNFTVTDLGPVYVPTAEEKAEIQITEGQRIAKELNLKVKLVGKKVNPNLLDIMQSLRFGELDDAKTSITNISTNFIPQNVKDEVIADINQYL